MIAIRQLLAQIPKVLLLVPVTLVTRATAKPVAAVSCLNLLRTKSIWIASVVNQTLSSSKNTLASKYTSMINAHKRIKKKWQCNWELEAHWLRVGSVGKVSPNWSQETMILYSSNCFSNKYCLGSGKRTIGDFSSEQLLHDHWFHGYHTSQNYNISWCLQNQQYCSTRKAILPNPNYSFIAILRSKDGDTFFPFVNRSFRIHYFHHW